MTRVSNIGSSLEIDARVAKVSGQRTRGSFLLATKLLSNRCSQTGDEPLYSQIAFARHP